MDRYRFHLPELLPQSGETPFRLPEEEAHHARNVLRLEAGSDIELFDGSGHAAPARLTAVTRQAVTATLTGPMTTDPPAPLELTLAVAIPKADRADTLVEQASQLEVAGLQWLDTERSVVKPREGGNKLAKWRRLAIETAKQCGRNRVLQIHEPRTLAALLADLPAGLLLWLEPRDDPATRPLARLIPSPGSAVTALIGPEGGWSDRERTLLTDLVRHKKIHRVLLTRTILRIETAAAATAALLLAQQ